MSLRVARRKRTKDAPAPAGRALADDERVGLAVLEALLDEPQGIGPRVAFLLELAHELRTPVTVLNGYLSLAHDGDIDSGTAVEIAYAMATGIAHKLELLLGMAAPTAAEREYWARRVTAAQTESRRLLSHSAEVSRHCEDVVERLRSRAAAAAAARPVGGGSPAP